ncbi:HD-GYP domain-containing protein [Rhodoferax sp.]|uniref:HD-GYP domain-containing protein n=1 Tax=Rhodoferax sp. TaxID=50421 RepID=UPI00374DEB02
MFDDKFEKVNPIMAPADPSSSPEVDPVQAAMAIAAFAIVMLAGTRSSDTGKHILRVQHYVKCLAQRLTDHPRFAATLTEPYCRILFQSVLLHDIGTIGIPDRILLKPAALTPTEYEIIKSHPTLARDAIERAELTLGYQAPWLQTVKELVYSHHEKWDGSGYPQGLAEEKIPLSARLMAIADVYDALISERVYRAGLPHDQAVGIIFQGRASHFDPDMVDVFIEIQDEFHAIALRFADTELDMQRKITSMANAIAEDVQL